MTDPKKQDAKKPKKPHAKAMKLFDRAAAYVEEARQAAVTGEEEDAHDLRRKANRAMKKGIHALSDLAGFARHLKKEVDPL